MITRVRSRLVRNGESDRGAYAILYAVLVVVLVGMASIVVDIAALREDRRDNRAAADSAATGAAEFLNPIGLGGVQPQKACLRAWEYLDATITNLGTPTPTPCTEFAAYNGPNALTYCASLSPAMIRSTRVVGDRTVIIAWPITRDNPATTTTDESQHFLTPDLAPGDVQQTFSATRDGTDLGCDRIGVAILQDRTFGLANGLGLGTSAADGQRTSVHSVARFDPDGGPADQVAALNVLNPTDCSTLVTTGGGKVLVGPTMDKGVVVGPGIIAVESDGKSATCSGAVPGGGERVIDPNRSSAGSLVCASNIPLTGIGPDGGCDGKGLIQSYALGLAGNPPRAFHPGAVPTNLKPGPTAKNVAQRWNPVTKLFGCNTLTPCIPPSTPQPNYIKSLVSALGGSGAPAANYSGSQSPYVDPLPGGFTNVPAGVCSSITGTIVLNAGNWYANCSISVATGGTLIIKGGTLVVEGGISLAGGSGNGGCLVVNTDVATCDAAKAGIVDAGLSTATTTPRPTRDAIIYVRGKSCGTACGFDHQGTLIMPQTFMYAADSAQELKVLSSKTTLWTAPGAGAVNASGRTLLEEQCYRAVAAEIDRACMNSRFSRLDYWSEYAAPKTKPNTFNGQGSLVVVGVFFTPTAYFNFTGGGSYTASYAQFWSDKLNVDGNAFLGLMPDVRTAIETPSGAISLIR